MFLDAGLYEKRRNAKCVGCGSLERHRILFLYFSKLVENKNNIRVLHFAPSKSLKSVLKSIKSIQYFTSDYPNRKESDYNFDIQNIDYEEEGFDFIILNHVLEHIQNDIKAMLEIYKILKPNGIALISVPLLANGEKKTYENPSIIEPDEKIKHFGQFDHVRIYGLDIIDRLIGCGFAVEKINFLDQINETVAKEFGLINSSKIDEIIFKCQK
jgi:SAM-dependent methyltransferase